jgi:hypothetical protein
MTMTDWCRSCSLAAHPSNHWDFSLGSKMGDLLGFIFPYYRIVVIHLPHRAWRSARMWVLGLIAATSLFAVHGLNVTWQSAQFGGGGFADGIVAADKNLYFRTVGKAAAFQVLFAGVMLCATGCGRRLSLECRHIEMGPSYRLSLLPRPKPIRCIRAERHLLALCGSIMLANCRCLLHG